MLRRSISMSQWLRGGLAFFGVGVSPVAVCGQGATYPAFPVNRQFRLG